LKPKLLIVEVWRMGDLVIATPFLQAASQKFDVTLLARPYAVDLQARFWPDVKVIQFTAPWTAFQGKYLLWKWPWVEMWRLRRRLRKEQFDYGLSARWDPRDHFLLWLANAKTRLGFQRVGSRVFLSAAVARPEPRTHRYESWRVMGAALGFTLPPLQRLSLPRRRASGDILIHTGAGQPVRVWPLERYRNLANRLRANDFSVRVACDPDQRIWWQNAGERAVSTPQTVRELMDEVDRAAIFIGNDSGPGHLAAFCGLPTFTIFGPQLPEWWAPLHPASEWMDGKACPYKPCSDYCRFPVPYCMVNSSEEEVWQRVLRFVHRTLAETESLKSKV
jgi:ADP-heptose:LPS heptosyltransferase